MAVEAHHVPSLRLGAFIGEVTFLPADPPRDAAFALWRPAPGFVPHGPVRLLTAGSHGVAAEELEAGLAPGLAAPPRGGGRDPRPSPGAPAGRRCAAARAGPPTGDGIRGAGRAPPRIATLESSGARRDERRHHPRRRRAGGPPGRAA